jgi:hypothetical protein
VGSKLKQASNKHSKCTAMTVKEMTVHETMRWLREHLADFPVPEMAYQFEFNGKVDAHERISHLPDEILRADELRKKRAQAVLDTYTGGFDGREGMNTLLCALYSPLAVSRLLRAAYADTDNSNRLAHVFVLRVGEVFLLLLTASPYKRFPLDRFMCDGEHTSAYMWLNLKEACWKPYVNQAVTPAAAPKPARKKQRTWEQKTWQQLSAATVSGLHILSVFWRRADVLSVNLPPALAADTAGAAPVLNHVYVQPPTQAVAVAGEDGAPDAWILKVESFAEQFTNSTPDTQSPAVLVVEEPIVAPMAKEETVVAPMVEGGTVVAPMVEGESVVSPIGEVATVVAPVVEEEPFVSPLVEEETVVVVAAVEEVAVV